MKTTCFTICLLLFTSQVFASDNVSVKHDAINGFCFTTIDITVTGDWLNKQDDVIEINGYPNIRQQGFTMDMFYSNAGLGKAQWTEMDTRGVYVMPAGIYLPVSQWKQNGMQAGWHLRISMLNPLTETKGHCEN